MSYCRAGDDSDVYVYNNSSSLKYECCGCEMIKDFDCDTPEEMLKHLTEHKKQGDKVPRYAIKRLKKEIKGE